MTKERVHISEQQQKAYVNFHSQDFFEAYKTSFCDNLKSQFSKLQEASQANQAIPFDVEELYDELFCAYIFDVGIIETDLELLVKATPRAYEVFKHALLLMVKDFSSELIGRDSGQLLDLKKLVNRISAYLEILYDVYFVTSQHTPWAGGHIDTEDPRYIRFLQSFSQYQQADAGAAGGNVTLLTTYKGLYVDCTAQVVSADGERLVFRSNSAIETALKHGTGRAFIVSPLHRRSFGSLCDKVDEKNHTITFSRILPERENWERPQQVCVEPEGIVSVQLSDEFGQIEGRLYDVSSKVVSIYCRTNLEDRLQLGSDVGVMFQLVLKSPTVKVNMNLSGKIQRMENPYKGDEHAYRVVVQLEHDAKREAELTSYINQRQSEILHELSEYEYDSQLAES